MIRKPLAILILMAAYALVVTAQTERRYAVKQPYLLELKRIDSLKTPSQLVRFEGAPWLRLHVAEYKLGREDFITFTSLKDGGKQRLDAESLPRWRNNTAYFNGDSVRVELYTTEGSAAFVKFTEVTVGVVQPSFQLDQDMTICGANDDRVSINDPAVGRINNLNNGTNVSNPFCTGWAISNGAFLTAGHCVDADPDGNGPQVPDGNVDAAFLNAVIEFNVPGSLANGTSVFSNPNDQYPVNQVTAFEFAGNASPQGTDWAVFSVSANSNTGLLPHPSRGFYRVTDQIPATNSENVRVSGYGLDNTPVGSTGGENAQTRTLQSHTAAYQGQTQANNGTFHSYQVDTMGANSGSPIIWSNNALFAIGIHTTGGCTSTGGSNFGTGFGHDPLETGVQNFWGPNTVYVDPAAYPNLSPAQRNGTIFRPHSTLTNGANATPAGGNVILTPGTYTGVTVINRTLTIRAPAGTVTISP